MMNDKTDKLSALMDGELRDLEHWSKQLASDKTMQAVWHRYHIARDAMKGQLSDYPQLDISASVSKALENEPVILAPLWRRIQPRTVFKQVAGLAVAATVATLAVLSVQQARIIDNETAQIAQLSAPVNASSAASGTQLRQVSFTTRQQLDAEVESPGPCSTLTKARGRYDRSGDKIGASPRREGQRDLPESRVRPLRSPRSASDARTAKRFEFHRVVMKPALWSRACAANLMPGFVPGRRQVPCPSEHGAIAPAYPPA